MASRAPVCWPLTYYPQLALEMGKEVAIDLIDSELYFLQCPIAIHIICNDRQYG